MWYNMCYNVQRRILNMKHSVKKQAVKQIIDGKMIAVYESRNKAAVSSGADVADIRKVCSGKRKTAGGFGWANANINIQADKAKKAGMIVQRLKGSVKAIYSDIKMASHVTGIKAGNIRYVIEGKRDTAGGFGWT